MAKTLSFKISSALKDIIGRDLISDDYVAIFELVKNSYDAHATTVKVIFLDIYSDNAKIIIEDDGKGMNYKDIKNKWLFVAYSAKREGLEDNDYRDKIYQNRVFAGAKGIGRFSCDRLGKNLKLETTKRTSDKIEILRVDWQEFEKSMKEEFVEIPVKHTFKRKNTSKLKKGTRLEISNLRSSWDKHKLSKLKASLSKLINPGKDASARDFQIHLTCEEEGYFNERVDNFIFETLEIKTSTVDVNISEDGKIITSELKDGGTRIYRITESNAYPLLRDISVKLFYLNKAAKLTFGHRMGVSTREYGSIFLYKNDIRIYPFGEFGEDPLKLDSRKAQKPSIYIGNKDLIGRIEIKGRNTEFKETSSRGDGFSKNDTYESFLSFLIEKVISRLERYVIDVQKWGDGSFLSVEDSLDDQNELEIKAKITALISKLTNSEDLIDVDYEENFLNLYTDSQSESALSLVKNLFRLAKNTGNEKILEAANRTEQRVNELYSALIEARLAAETASKSLAEKESENLFLKSIKSQDLDEVVSFLHHIGISSGIVDNYLTGLYNRINSGQRVEPKKILEILDIVVFENKKIQNISKFATKANFKLYTDAIEINLGLYLKEYVQNIVAMATNDGIRLSFVNEKKQEVLRKFRPIEINILVDNLFSNAKKAGATRFDIRLSEEASKTIMSFSDNGKGIEAERVDQIFDLGHTSTTQGSGIGLYHVKEIVKRINGLIRVQSTIGKGTNIEIVI